MVAFAMSVRCNLKVLIARENLKRAERGEAPVTMRKLAAETDLTLSSLSALATGKSGRIDFTTIDKLCTFFNVEVGDLLTRVPDERKTP